MKEVIPTSTDARSEMNVDKMLCRGIKNLAKLTADRVTPMASILSYSDESISGMISAIKYGPSSFLYYPVRIEAFEDLNTDIAASIILYNFGLSHSCMERSHFRQSISRKAPFRASRVLRLAQSTIVTYCDRIEREGRPETLPYCLTGLIMNALSQNLLEQGKKAEAAQTFAVSKQITDVVAEMEFSHDASSIMAPAA
jgi:hypothetical protein